MDVLVIMGPTASGKSALAMELARQFHAEIVNCDSMQVYTHMDIGTAKPSLAQREEIPHHLLDVAAPDEQMNAARFAALADEAIAGIRQRGAMALLVGGTGLWARVLLWGLARVPEIDNEIRMGVRQELQRLGREGIYQKLLKLDPEAAQKLHPNDSHRVSRALEVFLQTGRSLVDFQKEHAFAQARYSHHFVVLQRSREELHERIAMRIDRMLADGLLKEAQALLDMGFTPELPVFRSLGYRDVFKHLTDGGCINLLARRLHVCHRQYAKRQLTWFAREKNTIQVSAGHAIKDVSRLLQGKKNLADKPD